MQKSEDNMAQTDFVQMNICSIAEWLMCESTWIPFVQRFCRIRAISKALTLEARIFVKF